MLQTWCVWLYLRRWKVLYWALIAVVFVTDSIVGVDNYKLTSQLLFLGLCWWVWKSWGKKKVTPHFDPKDDETR